MASTKNLASTPCVEGVAYPTPLWACLRLDLPTDDLYGPVTEASIEYALTAMMRANPDLTVHWYKTERARLLETAVEDSPQCQGCCDPSRPDIEFIFGYDCKTFRALPKELFE